MSTFAALEPILSSLPVSWRSVPMRRVTDLIEVPNTGGSAELLSLLSATGEVIQRDPETQPPSTEYLEKYYIVEPGYLVVNPMWLIGGGVGVTRRRGAVSPDYRVYRPMAGIEPRYLHHLVRSQPYRDQYDLLVRATTTFDRRINKRDLAELPIIVPPEVEQRAIVDFLDAETARIDALITKKRRLLELLDERRIATTDRLIRGASGPQRPVATLGTYINGYPFKPDELGQDGLPVIRIRQLVNINAECDCFSGTISPEHLLRNGDIVFSWSGSLEVRVWDRGPAWLNQH